MHMSPEISGPTLAKRPTYRAIARPTYVARPTYTSVPVQMHVNDPYAPMHSPNNVNRGPYLPLKLAALLSRSTAEPTRTPLSHLTIHLLNYTPLLI